MTVIKEHGDAFSRQYMRLLQWTFDYNQDAFELGGEQRTINVASGIDDTLSFSLSLFPCYISFFRNQIR